MMLRCLIFRGFPAGVANTDLPPAWPVIVLVAASWGCGSAERDVGGTRSSNAGSAVTSQWTHATESAGLADFVHVTGAFGLLWYPETVGGGAGFFDFDGDGWEDIVLVGGGTWPERDDPPARALWIYRNRGDGTFLDATEESGLAGFRAYGFGVSAADYDNDGDQDLFLSALRRNMLFRNEGGVFSEVTSEAGLDDVEHWGTSAVFFDADLDGYLDLYVGNYIEWTPENDLWCTMDGESKAYCTPQMYTGTPGDFYHNNGDGTFSNWTVRAGFASSPGKTLGVAEWDFNLDGFSDLAVANDTKRNLLYLNRGDGTFTEEGVASGLAFDENGRSRAGMGIDVGVVDGSGMPAVVIGNFSNEMIGVYQLVAPGLFMDRAGRSRIGRPSLPVLTFGLILTDADVDGDLDVFAANGHIDESGEFPEEGVFFRQHPQLFVNQGDGRFEDRGPPVDVKLVARAVAAADFDRDGDEDLLVTENGGRAHLLRNDQAGGQAVRVRLKGREGNRDALGAYVTAMVRGRRLYRRVRTGSGFLSSSEKALTFGLGDAPGLDTLTVFWPGGKVERYTDLPAQHEIRIVEGEGIQETIALANPSRGD
jgi:hypothetical protein